MCQPVGFIALSLIRFHMMIVNTTNSIGFHFIKYTQLLLIFNMNDHNKFITSVVLLVLAGLPWLIVGLVNQWYHNKTVDNFFRDKPNIEWLVYCYPGKVEDAMWSEAFSNPDFTRICCNELGWDGGTIHQVIDMVKDLRRAYT